ncbi:MAG: hypothetical protein QOI82_1863 [Actinomycetota bacterium]|jgi:hypothetical protein|nr:hypothetical protein [Actinomycetota bacterium]
MSTRVLRPAVVAFVVVVLVALATAAQASAWTMGVAFGAKPASAQAQAFPAPTGVTLTCPVATQKILKVAWSAVAHAATYDIFYSTTSATTGFTAATTGVTATTWTSGTLANGTYYVQVSANVGTNWKSPNSASAGPRTIKSTATICS